MGSQILEVEAIEINPLEQTIEATLVKNNVTDKVISALSEKYGSLKLKSIDDKEGYLEICEARKEVRKVGIITEKICKMGREDAIKVQKLWLGKEKDVLAKIAAVQDPLDAEIKRFEDEIARKESEEAERKEQAYMHRQTTLLKMEAKYENNCFTLGNVSYEVSNIKEADDEIWNETILPKYKREFEKIETVRVEEENKKQAEIEKLRLEKEKFEQEQTAFKKQQEEFQQQQAALQKQKDEADRLIREQQQKEADALREKQDAQNKARMQQVMALGLNYSGQYKSFVFQDVNVAEVDIVTLNEEQWNSMIAEISPVVIQRKAAVAQEAEDKHQQEIEQAKQDAIKKENERIAEENRITELKRQEDLAKASDKEKWDAFIFELSGIEYPQFKSSGYKNKLAIAKEKIDEIQGL